MAKKYQDPTKEMQLKAFTEGGNIEDRGIVREMETCYLDYAMSVIVSRALPDVRDGLKPVHRRILYAMHELGLHNSSKYKKSANVVGTVLAKYHPHGDIAVYDAMVRLAQEFSLRYPLVDGQGNFGSIDGDSAAAMRYTESRMAKIADEMLADIDKETVDFAANYDGSETEPRVLPTRIPNLLLMGTMGIAVGMATNIPPHNLGELMDGLSYLVENPDCGIEDLMQYVKGPDFPTSGIIYDVNAIREAYSTGRGSIIMRSRATIEEKGGKPYILVTEIPYQVNKASMIMKIAELVRDKKIVGITDIRDESNREGIRVVIELKKDSHPKKILNQLYKMTPMQSSFGVNMIALVDRGIQPQLLDLKTILEHFIAHRVEVVTNRTKYILRKTEERVHILEGLKIALDNIDAVIKTIRAAETRDQAKTDLMAKFKLSEIQSEAILLMQLQKLAGLERKKIEDELAEKLALIEELKAILADEKKILAIVKKEFIEIKEQYSDPRRTEIIPTPIGKFSITDVVPNEETIVTLTQENYIKRVSPSSYRVQRRGGKGIVGMTTKDEDEIHQMLSTKTHNELLFFTTNGRVFKMNVYDIPFGSRQAKGQAVVNLLNLGPDERIATILDLTAERHKYLFMTSTHGTIKKTELEEFRNIRASGIIAMKLKEGEELLWVRSTTGENEMLLISALGQSVRFSEKDVRPMGRNASGVRGMKLKGEDRVVEMDVIRDPKGSVIAVTGLGLGKNTPLEEYRLQTRGGSGVKVAQLTAKTGNLVGACVLEEGATGELLLVSKLGQMLRINIAEIPARGRVTQGVYIMRFKEKGDHVASISFVPKDPNEMIEGEGEDEVEETTEE